MLAVNEDCEFFDQDQGICNYIETLGLKPSYGKNCACGDCISALYAQRGLEPPLLN